jgi:hypothetical protein
MKETNFPEVRQTRMITENFVEGTSGIVALPYVAAPIPGSRQRTSQIRRARTPRRDRIRAGVDYAP